MKTRKVYIVAKFKGCEAEIVDECEKHERQFMVDEYRLAYGPEARVSSTMSPSKKLLSEWNVEDVL